MVDLFPPCSTNVVDWVGTKKELIPTIHTASSFRILPTSHQRSTSPPTCCHHSPPASDRNHTSWPGKTKGFGFLLHIPGRRSIPRLSDVPPARVQCSLRVETVRREGLMGSQLPRDLHVLPLLRVGRERTSSFHGWKNFFVSFHLLRSSEGRRCLCWQVPCFSIKGWRGLW